jgi:hypothetical protein
VRFRENKPGDLDRARAVVAAWREENPDGTPEQLVGALGGQFHRDYRVVLRCVLFAVDRRRSQQATGITDRPAGAGQ